MDHARAGRSAPLGALRPAPLGARFAARLVDLVILAGIAALVASAAVRALPGGWTPTGLSLPVGIALSAVTFAVYLAYEVGFTMLHGGTPGKRLFGLSVAAHGGGADPAGGRPGPFALVKRSGVLYASVLFNYVPVLGLLALVLSVFAVVSAVLDRSSHRGLHDGFAGTVVVTGRARSVPS
ncbi:putative RDD family membrane protein YckC [Spinactinospora alkalitolerans]|uniref:Putative RDD family membrane protein YckC n=1 Tax=Spinactinospora alkalitolerans TaxID=687207 RepID=A0A852TX26_9ACTN|nr:RDD family protein [Spinactinospora alkalitolerans]NYE46604.1 putative RDD family membrane protein YckC [Spinactinospora alkalitolerans]